MDALIPGYQTHLSEGVAEGAAVAFAASHNPDDLDSRYKVEDGVPQLVIDKFLALDWMALTALEADAEDP